MRKGIFIFTSICVCAAVAFAAKAPNPRGGTTERANIDIVQRGTPSATGSAVSVRASVTTREKSNRPGPAISGSRAGIAMPSTIARIARTAANAPLATGSAVSRSATARATAVFGDMTKMGTGYAGCYDTYNTCMDQFCSAANNSYRRCFCSDKFKQFRDTEDALAQAKSLLLNFNDNNLNVVDKTAEEVKAMYSASDGENALKRDVSASSKMLTEIEDLLSGRKKAPNSKTSVDLSSINFTDISNIWDNQDDWLSAGGRNVSTLEGLELYNESNRQCTVAANNSCEGTSGGMVRSAYGILVAQDCNTYEKRIAADKETIQQTIREAYKVLRTARLEEYRSHNSIDMNECIAKVRGLVQSEHVCGAGFKKCLDPTGLYVNSTTGEPLYFPRLFNLASLIELGSDDVVGTNPNFNRSLDSKRKFAETALDTCRNISESVWKEFKRAAIIEIAQAQDAVIESVKSTCVSTMKECYDGQSGQLAIFDNSKGQASGAMIAKTTSQMCREKVLACAALFGGEGSTPCTMNPNGVIANGDTCGLASLWTFVETVDNMKATEGCEVALNNYAKDLCKGPASSEYAYPYGCRLISEDKLKEQLTTYATSHCIDPATRKLIDKATNLIDNIVAEIHELMGRQFQGTCTKYGGIWMTDVEEINALKGETELETSFNYTIYGGIDGLKKATNNGITVSSNSKGRPIITSATNVGRGICILNNVATQCRMQNADTGNAGYVKYNPITGECEIDDGWYKVKCEGTLQGTWNTGTKTCMYK